MAQIQMQSQKLQDSFCYPTTEFFMEHNGELDRYCYNVGGIDGGSMLVSYDDGHNWYLANNNHVHVDLTGVKVVVIPPFTNINSVYFNSLVKASYQLMQCAINDPNFIMSNGATYDSNYLACTHKVYCEFVDIFNNQQISALCNKEVSNTPMMTPTSPNTPPTTLIAPSSVTIGIKNIVNVNSFNIDTSACSTVNPCTCPSENGIILTSCFSIQQNFFINSDVVGAMTSYWAQNVVEIGKDANGKTYAGALYNIYTVPIGTTPVCPGAECPYLVSLHQVSLPITITLTSELSGGQLVMNNIWNDNNQVFTFPCWIKSICFSSLPTGSTMYITEGKDEPQLDIVGGSTQPHISQNPNTAIFLSADLDVESFVKLLNSQSYTQSVIQIPRSIGGTNIAQLGISTGETSCCLQLESTGINTAHFSEVNGMNYPTYFEGVGYVPNVSTSQQTQSSNNYPDNNGKICFLFWCS